MATYDFSYGEGGDLVIRVKEISHGSYEDREYDMLQLSSTGDFSLNHTGVPEVPTNFASTFTNSDTFVTVNLPTQATQGNLLVACVLVDISTGAHGIIQQDNWNNIGDVVVATGELRMHVFTKVATGAEVGSGSWQINGGAGEIALICAELPGYNGGFLIDQQVSELDATPQTTASLVDAASSTTQNNAFWGFLGTSLATHTGVTDAYTELTTVASANLRLTMYYKLFTTPEDASNPGVLDFDVTLGTASPFVVKAAALTPNYPVLKVDNIRQNVLIHNVELPRLDEAPLVPPTDNSILYSTWQPGATGQQRWVVIHDDQELYQVPFVRSDGPTYHEGDGSPEGVVTAKIGSMYVNRTGGAGVTWYVKESGGGNTGWVAK